MSNKYPVHATVADLIAALQQFPPDSPLHGEHPPWNGIRIIPQTTGSLFLTGPGREDGGESDEQTK